MLICDVQIYVALYRSMLLASAELGSRKSEKSSIVAVEQGVNACVHCMCHTHTFLLVLLHFGYYSFPVPPLRVGG